MVLEALVVTVQVIVAEEYPVGIGDDSLHLRVKGTILVGLCLLQLLLIVEIGVAELLVLINQMAGRRWGKAKILRLLLLLVLLKVGW